MNNLLQKVISKLVQEKSELSKKLRQSEAFEKAERRFINNIISDVFDNLREIIGYEFLDEYVESSIYSEFRQKLTAEIASDGDLSISWIYRDVMPALRAKVGDSKNYPFPTPEVFIEYCYQVIGSEEAEELARCAEIHARPKPKPIPKNPLQNVIYLYEVHGTGIDGRVFKIGVTSSHCGRDRIGSVCKELKGTTFTEIRYEVIKRMDVLNLEKILLDYGACPDLGKFGGYTEMRVFNDDELDEIVAAIDTAK